MALPLSNSSHPSTDEALSTPAGYVQWLFLYQTLPTHPQMKLSPLLPVMFNGSSSIKLFPPIHRRSSLHSCRLCSMALPLSNSSYPSTDEALSIPAGYVQWLFLYQTLPTHPQMKLSPFLQVMCNGSSSIKLFLPIHRRSSLHSSRLCAMALPLSNSSYPSTDEALSTPVGYVQWLFLYQTLPTHPQTKLSPLLSVMFNGSSSIKLFPPIHRRSSLHSCRLCSMALPLSNSSYPSTDEALSTPVGYVQWLFLYQTLPIHPQTKLSPLLPVMCNGSSSIKLFPPIHR